MFTPICFGNDRPDLPAFCRFLRRSSCGGHGHRRSDKRSQPFYGSQSIQSPHTNYFQVFRVNFSVEMTNPMLEQLCDFSESSKQMQLMIRIENEMSRMVNISDLAQLMDAKDSQTNGEFLIEGNTLK